MLRVIRELISHTPHLPKPKRSFIATTTPRFFTSAQLRSQDQSPAKNTHNNKQNNNNDSNSNNGNANAVKSNTVHNDQLSKSQNAPEKTTAQRDEELRQKMSGIAGDGGESGVEYEDGQPVAMRRSVRNNMFRYI
ncbi:hypothetical protein F5Y14DRAFT_272523 [Nemania sp. NC0429]|nr:hypothetical protein F5Y14DRAFT_272523 [Nemania sp. NC0429]